MEDVTLTVNGSAYGGWKTIGITLSMERLAGAFSLGVSERWPGQSVPRGIQYGDECRLKIGPDVVITGYVDQLSVEYDRESHSVTVSGRDRAGDMVDSSALHAPGSWRQQTILTIARALAAPFGIPVHCDVAEGEPFPTFAIEPGESAYETLERMAKMRGALIMSDGQGGLLITRTGRRKADTSLTLGENIKACNAASDYQQRFSQIIVKGQTQGRDDVPASRTAGYRGTANDADVRRYRPLLAMAESQADSRKCQERADWEVAVRRGKSTQIQYTVVGWRQGSGALWEINRLVQVTDPLLKLNQPMLIAGVNFRVDHEGGSITELTVTDPDAYRLMPEPEWP